MNRDHGYRKWKLSSLLLAGLMGMLIAASPALAQKGSGSLDSSFGSAGSRGLVNFDFGGFDQKYGWVRTASLPDGSSYVLAGDPFRLFRIGPDGDLVSSFGDSGERRLNTMIGTTGVDWDQVFAAPDGGAILFGSSDFGNEFKAVNRLLPNGKQNPNFGKSGPMFLTNEHWATGGVDENGRIILASRDNLVTRLKPNGKIDRSFGNKGIARPGLPSRTSDYPYALTSANEGIYVATSSRTFRLKQNGELDRSFGGGTGYVKGGGRRIDVVDDGLVVQESSGRVTRLLTDGTPDPGYGTKGNGTAFGNAANQAEGTLLEDGSLIFISPRGPEEDRLYDVTRLDPDGIPDPTFAGDGRLEADWLDGSTFTYPWTIGGDTAAIWGNLPGQGLTRRVDADGNLDPQFGDGGVASIRTPRLPDLSISDSAQRKDRSYLMVGSLAESWAGDYGMAVASYTRNGRPDQGFGDGGKLVLMEPTQRWDPKPKMTVLPSGAAMICAKVGSDSVVWKVSRDGQQVEDFGENGRLTLPFSGRCRDISYDGTGAVLSAMEVLPGRTGVDLIRVLPDGTLDSSYGIDGVAKRPDMADNDYFWVYDNQLLSDRRGRTLLIASRGDARYITRHTKDGFPDTSFGFNGKIHFGLDSVSQDKDGQKPIYLRGLEKIRGTALGPNGAIFLTGSYAKRPFVAKLTSKGFPDRGFGKRGVMILPGSNQSQAPFLKKQVHARAYGLGVRSDGSVIVTGTSRPVCSAPFGCTYPLMLKRIRPDGKLDRGFANRAQRGIGHRPDAIGMFVHFDGARTVVTGSMSVGIERSDLIIARFR